MYYGRHRGTKFLKIDLKEVQKTLDRSEETVIVDHDLGETRKKIVGIILLNLGGPDSLRAIKPFLYNLFSDRNIIRLGPSFLQKPIAWFISNIRSKKTEKMYSLIGGKSPILDITFAQARALENALNLPMQPDNSPSSPLEKGGKGGFERGEYGEILFKVYVGMRYWYPYIEEVIPKIYNDGIRRLIAISMYPHYSHATAGSSLARLEEVLSEYPIEVFYITSWFNHPLYVEALIDVIKKGLDSFNLPTPPFNSPLSKGGHRGVKTSNSEPCVHVLFSAHNLPEALIKEGDPYVEQIQGTIGEIVKKLNIEWDLSFQSKSGPVKWLKPTTEETIERFFDLGFKNILLVPISFVSDHIETLYEIDILYKNIAKRLGIELKRVDSLNTHPLFIEALKDMVIKGLSEKGWI